MVPKPPYSLDSSTWLSEVGKPFLAPLLGCVGDSIVRHLLIIEAGSSKGRQEQSEEGHRERVSFSARGSGPGRCHEGSATRCAPGELLASEVQRSATGSVTGEGVEIPNKTRAQPLWRPKHGARSHASWLSSAIDWGILRVSETLTMSMIL